MLGGGFVEGSSFFVQGEPGAGKTVLATQIAFGQAKAGKQVLYATLMAESHERLFQSLSTMDYYDASLLGRGVTFVSVFQTMRDEGLDAVVALLRKEISRQSASVLIIDGLLTARDRANSNLDVKTFLAEIQGHAAFAGCTVLFLTSAGHSDPNPEHTMVDGVLELTEEIFGVRSVRLLRVRKARGIDVMGGFHQFAISQEGMRVFPRVENQFARPTLQHDPEPRRIHTGSPSLDALIGGGVPEGSITVVAGPPGSGKTTAALSFLAAAPTDKSALLFGFYEPPSRLRAKAEALGIDFASGLASGRTEIIWQPLTENLLDELGHRLLDAVGRMAAKQVVIDGVAGFERASNSPERLLAFFSALENQLRGMGVTTLATFETTRQRLPASFPVGALLSGIDNLIELDHLLIGGELLGTLEVVKMRDSAFEPDMRVVTIARGGLSVGEKVARAAAQRSYPAAL